MAPLTTSLGVAASLVFAVLSALHLFWAAGGRSGLALAIPEEEGAPVFRPSALATVGVAAALALAAVLVAARALANVGGGAGILIQAGCFGVAALFLLRALGDFRYVGAFKKIRGTRFARWDSLVYTPLCLLLGGATLAVALGWP